MLPIRQPTNSWVQGRVRTPRKTNVLRPVYRLGWLVIWSTWLVTVVLVMPALVSRHYGFHRAVLFVLVSAAAYFLHRLWDRWITGRPMPRSKRHS